MSNEYIDREVSKILNEEGLSYPKNLALAIAWILGNFKGINLKILDVKNQSSIADFFVLASATNITQAQSMAEAIVYHVKKSGGKVLSKEGFNTDWILIDAGDIIVHIFQDTTRNIYDLDGLWLKAIPVGIPQSYYFSGDSREGIELPNNESERDFF